MGLGQLWLSQITAPDSYQANVLAAIMLTVFRLGIAFPTVSIAGIPSRQQGVAGGLFVTAQQVSAAAGLAVLAAIAGARTHAAHGSLVGGYRLSVLVAAGIMVAAAGLSSFSSGGPSLDHTRQSRPDPLGCQQPPPQHRLTLQRLAASPRPPPPSPNQLIRAR
ncbi:MAG: hypothetical protein ACHP9Z_16785 [Streptosporangiales bacterium]